MSASTARTGRVDMTATAACLGALCCWSVGPILIAQLTHYLDSWTQNALRYTVACLFWLPVLLYFAYKGKLDNRIWRRAALPALANVAMQSLWAATFYYIGPAFTVLLSKTSVLWMAAFSLVFFVDERVLARSGRFWAGLALSLTGVFGVLYFKENFAASRTATGIVLSLICAFMWGAYAIAVKVSLKDIDSRIGFAVISLYTVIGLWIGAMVRGEPSECLALGVKPWMTVVFSAITGIALGHVFFYTAIKRIGATIPSLLILVQPLTVFSISSVIFRERLNGLQALFGLVLLTGAALSVWAQEHLKAPPQDSRKGR